MRIFVANLPYYINSSAIVELFGLFGAVISSKIITENGKSKGFGFLEMENDQQAQLAIQHLNGSLIADRNLIVQPADHQAEPERIHKRPRLFFSKVRK